MDSRSWLLGAGAAAVVGGLAAYHVYRRHQLHLAEAEDDDTDPDMLRLPLRPCAACGATQRKTRRCTRCLQVAYCSQSCQAADWKTHKAVCGTGSAAGAAGGASGSRSSSSNFIGNAAADREAPMGPCLASVIHRQVSDNMRVRAGFVPGDKVKSCKNTHRTRDHPSHLPSRHCVHA